MGKCEVFFIMCSACESIYVYENMSQGAAYGWLSSIHCSPLTSCNCCMSFEFRFRCNSRWASPSFFFKFTLSFVLFIFRLVLYLLFVTGFITCHFPYWLQLCWNEQKHAWVDWVLRSDTHNKPWYCLFSSNFSLIFLSFVSGDANFRFAANKLKYSIIELRLNPQGQKPFRD